MASGTMRVPSRWRDTFQALRKTLTIYRSAGCRKTLSKTHRTKALSDANSHPQTCTVTCAPSQRVRASLGPGRNADLRKYREHTTQRASTPLQPNTGLMMCPSRCTQHPHRPGGERGLRLHVKGQSLLQRTLLRAQVHMRNPTEPRK